MSPGGSPVRDGFGCVDGLVPAEEALQHRESHRNSFDQVSLSEAMGRSADHELLLVQSVGHPAV